MAGSAPSGVCVEAAGHTNEAFDASAELPMRPNCHRRGVDGHCHRDLPSVRRIPLARPRLNTAGPVQKLVDSIRFSAQLAQHAGRVPGSQQLGPSSTRIVCPIVSLLHQPPRSWGAFVPQRIDRSSGGLRRFVGLSSIDSFGYQLPKDSFHGGADLIALCSHSPHHCHN